MRVVRTSVRSVAVKVSGVRGVRNMGVAYSKTPPTNDDNNTLTTAGKGNGGTAFYIHVTIYKHMLLFINICYILN